MSSHTNSFYAAVHASEFPAQAILRLRPDLRSQPVVVLDGAPPKETVCALNLNARKRGIVLGMTRLEVEEMDGIHVLTRTPETERAARTVLLDCVSQFSPRIEEIVAPHACGYVLDITGTERLFGAHETIARRLRNTLNAAGFRASIAISANFHTARIWAEFARGISVIPIGKEASALADIPIRSLHLNDDQYETFALWGIRTLGDLAELSEEELITRMGQQSLSWLQISRGVAPHTFQPIEETFLLREHIDFESHIEQLDSLLFIGANIIDNLVSRASTRALCLASLKVEMSLEGSRSYNRVIRPAIPSTDRKFLLKLLQLELAAYTPATAVMSLTITAEAGQQSKVQLSLFTPSAPEPSRLDVTLARLKTLVGADRVGSPVISDSHRDGSFVMEEFVVADPTPVRTDIATHTSLRRIRPAHHVCVTMQDEKPASFRDAAEAYNVQVAYGPWHLSGNWWAVDKWDIEEWDVLATNNNGEVIGCLLVHDHLNEQWLLDALYD